VYLTDVRRKAKILGDIRMILGRMISESYKTDSEIFWTLQLARFKDMGTYGLDILRRRRDIRSLTASAVLDKYKIPGG